MVNKSQNLSLKTGLLKKSGYICTPILKEMFRKLFLRIAVLLLLCIALQAKADKTIYLLADIHVMAPSLLDSSDNIAWQKDLAEQRKMQELSAPVFDLLVERIITDHPDVLLICGDLTKDGEKASHQYVIEKLTKIENAGIPVYIIPGNHDHGEMEEARKYANNTYTPAEGGLTEAQFRTAYKDFGYGENCEIYEGSLCYAVELFPGLTLIGIDTGTNTHVRSKAITWAYQKALEAKDKGNQIIAMAHHSLIPHFYGQETFMPYSMIDNHEIVRDSLLHAGVKVVFTGHYHISDNTRYIDSEGNEIYDICTGSPISYPCDFRKLVFNDEFKQLKILTESIKTFDGYDDFPAYAKSRLTDAFYKWAYNWFQEHNVNELVSEGLSQSVGDAFIIHAEGNEPENPGTEEILLLFEEILAMASFIEGGSESKITEVCLTIKSMLSDYPSEDEKDNVVNDRELIISMTGEPVGIRSIPMSAADDYWYTLQGQRLNGKPVKPGVYIHNGKKIISRKP